MKDLQNKLDVARKPKSGFTDIGNYDLIEQWEDYPTSSGRTQYLRYLKGEKLTYREAVLAHCAECNCGYIDGRLDCNVSKCPLYPFMPYKGKQVTI